ncbi:Rab3 GTPase-activating protein catalytic subunit-domain-containing protein [Radiomyces spectabilis]|uniref:Rab3 GTPase-activating protein catalytic subunit-domain-containing protein n=1 Tax=Radiomyces spectabilis TaxID=64574 RepID=UPI0022200A70|nr:Rab3 GTPase-activating protein catalytic subunit-domain-containing protein [Radiomyces spectabilis]KAI8391695.1 Rab3 GTPase-activating protein catalytic subunit-domain-containing protein [Radiomyces spectabilis]
MNKSKLKRRQSSTQSEDLFEFVDYTSVSNFERLATAIEQALCEWGLKDAAYGCFSDDQLAIATAALTHPIPTDFTRHETLAIGEDLFKLSYHCHPAARFTHHDSSSPPRDEHADLPLALDEFYRLTSVTEINDPQDYHPLHRWTGMGRLLILKPMTDNSKLKYFSTSSRSVDIHQAKTLISACAIAFRNINCSVPIFVPIGQSRNALYNGYMLQNDSVLEDVEIRFNTTLTSPLLLHYTELDGLHSLFQHKLAMSQPNHGASDRQIWTAAVFTYDLPHDYDEDWKNLNESVGGTDTMSGESQAQRWSTLSFSEEMDEWDNEHPTTLFSKNAASHLAFGSYNDPLRSLTLSAIFPMSPDGTYTDETMDALTATHWRLSREFAPANQQRAFLSTLIDQVTSSWIRDPENRQYLAPYDDNNTLEETTAAPTNDNRLVRHLLSAVGHNRGATAHPPTAMSVSDQMESILASIFRREGQQGGKEDDEGPHVSLYHMNNDIAVYTAQALGLRLRQIGSVPSRSFLWNMVFYTLKLFSDTPKLQSTISFISFLRYLWIEALRRIRWHWENLVPIPDINPYLYRKTSSSESSLQNSSETVKDGPSHEKTLGIDLRYNILHQKLAMVNCCIYRQLEHMSSEEREALAKKAYSSPKKKVSSLFDNLSDTPSSTATPAAEGNSLGFDGLNSLLEKLVDPEEASTPGSSSRSNSRPEPSESDDISEGELFFDSVEDIENAALIGNHKTEQEKKNSEEDREKPIMDESSRGSSLSDVSVLARPPPMGESFVRLNYPSSADSDAHYISNASNFLVQKKEKNREIMDSDAAEGRKYPSPHLHLLATKEPMWIPETQEPGFMTEDMIKQQAEVFESLGTSDGATQLRAQLQSAQLFSDMEAFKAANPHASLEDFIRWHSPKDWLPSSTVDGENSSTPLEGKLSARMADPKNIWQELWKSAKRIPATRQKPLFSTTAEAEKALHYLESMSIHETFAMLLPTLVLIAYKTLTTHPIVHFSRCVAEGLASLGSEVARFSWEDVRDGKQTMDNIIALLRQQESTMCNGISLLRKMPKQYELVDRLLRNSQTFVDEGEERSALFDIFKNEQNIMSRPRFKEYIHYSDCCEMAFEGRKLPQRQYTLVKENEIRIVDMQTTDALYT